jgi:hypothetical protein
MNASVKSIGRMADLEHWAKYNGWNIVRVESDEEGAVVLFDRGGSYKGLAHRYGTAAYFWVSSGFTWGHYDMTWDGAQEDFRERCNRHFPV